MSQEFHSDVIGGNSSCVRHTSSDRTTSEKMALGSKTSFKSYIEAPAEESLISFDDEDTTKQAVDPSDQINSLENSNGNTGKSQNTMAVDGGNQNNGLFSLTDKSPDVDSDIEEVQPVNIMSSSEVQDSSRLCGYLNKYKVGARGLGRIFKKRWFVFVDSSCKLLYFRTPKDIVPLGEIDVSNASFNMEVSHEGDLGSGRDHVFEIRWVDL